MDDKELNTKDLTVSTSTANENNSAKENEEVYVIPRESSCSTEFPQGCIFKKQVPAE